MRRRERLERRAERLTEWAEKRQRKSAQAFDAGRRATEGIPFGQPILVGHHSERRHRAALDRADRGMRAGIEHADKAASMTSRAGNIEAALDRAIFDDDPDALDRLRAKLADLEQQRAAMVEANKAYRKTHRQELAAVSSAYERSRMVPYAGYELSNLGGVITKTRERIKRLEGTPAPVVPPCDCGATGCMTCDPAFADPIARAGLIIRATMTTPSRPGKQPRPVWNVGGNLGPHRAMLDGLGGSWYRGVFSFWEDPTDAITTALEESCHEDH